MKVWDSETEWHWERDESATYEAYQLEGMAGDVARVKCKECGQMIAIDLDSYYDSEFDAEEFICEVCVPYLERIPRHCQHLGHAPVDEQDREINCEQCGLCGELPF